MSIPTKTRKPKGYLLLLTGIEVMAACKHAETGKVVPYIAERFNLTLNQTIHMLRKEGYSKFIKWTRYGKKKYKWNHPETKAILQSAVDKGLNDDEIAKMFETTFQAISRGRSTAGIVAYTRAVGKGHQSKREFSHIDTNNMTAADVLIHQSLAMDIPLPFESKQMNWPGVKIRLAGQQLDFLTELDEEHERIAVNQQDEVIIQQIERIQKKIDGREGARKILEDAGILKKVPTDNFTVCFDEDEVDNAIKQRIVSKMTWKSIAQRIQNPEHLYELEGHYYRQYHVDTYTELVLLQLVRSVTPKAA